MDRPPLCPQLRTLGLSPPSAVPCLLGKAEEWNHWVVRHFCVYLLKEWQHHSLIRYFIFLFLKFQLITLFDCTGSLLRCGNSWLRMWFPDRDQTRAPALGGRSLNLWTTREVLNFISNFPSLALSFHSLKKWGRPFQQSKRNKLQLKCELNATHFKYTPTIFDFPLVFTSAYSVNLSEIMILWL